MLQRPRPHLARRLRMLVRPQHISQQRTHLHQPRLRTRCLSAAMAIHPTWARRNTNSNPRRSNSLRLASSLAKASSSRNSSSNTVRSLARPSMAPNSTTICRVTPAIGTTRTSPCLGLISLSRMTNSVSVHPRNNGFFFRCCEHDLSFFFLSVQTLFFYRTIAQLTPSHISKSSPQPQTTPSEKSKGKTRRRKKKRESIFIQVF